MTRDKMIKALAKRMAFSARDRSDVSEDPNEHWAYTGDAGKVKWIKVAAAVLDLCGPKNLVWAWPNDYGVVARAVTAHGTYSLHDDEDSAGGRMFVEFHITGDADCTKYAIRIDEGYCEPEELQAAAQAHADAAHWANTPLGKLVGV
jgi:hypothetical protein